MEVRVTPALFLFYLKLIDGPEPLLPELLDTDQTAKCHLELVPLFRNRADLRHRPRAVVRIVLGPVADDPLARRHPRRLPRKRVVVDLPESDLAVAAVASFRHAVLDTFAVDIFVGRQPVTEAHG